MRPGAIIGKGISVLASGAWNTFQAVNRRIPERTVQPKWAPAPMLKSRERTFPQLGWPRETDSLCPRCVKDVRAQILTGEKDLSTLTDGKPGEIKATILEEDGLLKMVKTCPTHGRFEDVMSIDPAFTRRIE